MKNVSIIAVVCFVGVVSCTKKESATTTNTADTMETVATADYDTMDIAKNCYLATTGKDSVFLQIEDNLGTVVGNLRYKNYEKDSSSGDVTGTSSGDTLKLTYAFESEGLKSEREIWFLKKDNGLLEGIGEYDASGTKYRDPKKIQFGDGHKFESQPCVD